MRIHRLSITGFGPFLDTQTVDFDGFADRGIFLISGRTGAGKSTILDAVVYALYNSAPRYGDTGGRYLRSDHCAPHDPTRVELVFSADGQTYRIVRSPEYLRPKSRGTGFTTEKATAELSRREGDDWVALASQLRTVGEELHHILPLDRDQFLQVVLLAQGQFQRFLVASSDERQKLLRTLFRSDRFTSYDAVMQRRAGDLRRTLELAESGVEATIANLAQHAECEVPALTDDEWLTGVVAAHDTEVEVARDDLEHAQKELRSAHEVLTEVTDLAERQRRFTGATELMGQLTAAHDAIEADRQRCDRAVAASSVAPARRAVRSATQQVERADTELARLGARYADVVGGPVPQDLTDQRDGFNSRLALLESCLADEQELDRLVDKAARGERELTDLAATIDDLVRRRAVHAQVLSTEIETTSEQARATVERLRTELQRSTRLQTARHALERAEIAQLRHGKALTAASTALDSLRQRRLANHAGMLAQELRDGLACAVCGSTEHPAPASLAGEPVTQQMLDDAQDLLDAATADARGAHETVVALRTTVEDLQDARPVAEATDAVATAEQVLVGAEHAELEHEQSRAELERLTEAQQRREVRRAALAQELSTVAERVEALAVKVDQARDGAETIAAQIAGVRGRLEVTSQVVAAEAEATAARRRLADAEATFARTLEHHGFADEPAFVDALVDASTLEELRARVERHDKALAGAEATLSAPELQDLPDEPADVDAARAAHWMAEAAHKETSERFGAARNRARTSHDLASSIRRAWSSTARDRAEFEVVDRLAKSLHGESPNTRRMRLESYVLGGELAQIVQAANIRLQQMSSGRFLLQRSAEVATRGSNAGLEVEVRDEYTGLTRSPESLSGGEKFLASLSLALGLADVVTSRAGGITLDTLFIDEGFGSLDAETLDLAMHTLESLRENGRTIGLISHVETMKEQLPAQLVVDRSAQGTSSITVRI